MSSEGFGRIRYDESVRRLLRMDPTVRRYLEGESSVLPAFYMRQMRDDLGSMWQWLPRGAMSHDPYAFRTEEAAAVSARGITPALLTAVS
jgi:hypothetical protein